MWVWYFRFWTGAHTFEVNTLNLCPGLIEPAFAINESYWMVPGTVDPNE